MKRIILVLVIVGFAISAGANVLEQMLELERSGVQNADLYYNIGVGYWQTGQSGKANLYFLRALNLNSAHKAAAENLDYICGLSPDKDQYPQRLFLVRVFFAAYDFMSLNRMAILCLVLLFIAALSLHWLMHYDPEKERAFPELISGIAVILFIVAGIFLGIKAYRQAFNNKAVVIADTAELRSEADQTASRLALIHENLILTVEKTKGEWCLVRTPNGTTGWLPAADLARVLAKAEAR
jgi:hypothetical protein